MAQPTTAVPATDRAVHLGLNVYLWGRAEQARFLTGHLAPAVRALRREGAVRRFWYGRFDARGPHVFALFSGRTGDTSELEARLAPALDEYLAADPSGTDLSPEALATLHAQCRGKTLCAADRLAGMAENNTYRFCAHPADEYPLSLSHGLSSETEFWDRVDTVTSWAVDRLATGSTTVAAVRWICAVDHALRRAGAPPAAFWRHHAETLITTLTERLASDERSVLDSLPSAVGDRNREAFESIWQKVGDESPEQPPAGALVEQIVGEPGLGDVRRMALLREVNHTTLAQLFQPVQAHVPLILFAWQRDL